MNSRKYYGLVNRKKVIATLEDKALITGFRWQKPDKTQRGFRKRRSKNGDFLYYSLTESVTIRDVDGRDKVTIKTGYFEEDKTTPHKQASYGVWCDGLAGTYHGRKSRNWQQEHLTLSEIIEVLNVGYAFAPGLFNPPAGESCRSGDYCEHRQIIPLDGDEWSEDCPAPADLDALLARYPDLSKDFYWIGESISSRSSLKPELRTRLILVPPRPILKGETELWEAVIDWAVAKYPFIARGVGIDKVRLSFGNARPECESRVLGGLVSLDTFSELEQEAKDKAAKAEELRIETEKQKKERQEHRDKNNTLKTELKRLGHSVTENVDPIWAFCEVDTASLLTDLGLASHLSGNAWNWHDSSPGRSFELSDGVIKPFSNTMQSASPETDSTKPVNAHRYILYYLHKLDMTSRGDQRELRCILADHGYGTHPDDYREAKRAEKAAAVREGLVSPLELRSTADPLPKEQGKRVLQTLEQNALLIREAFFEKLARVVGLCAGTGEGKNEQAVSYAAGGGSVAMTLNSLPLAEQVHTRFNDAGAYSFLWRSRWHGYGSSESNRQQVSLIPIRERIRSFQQRDVLCIKPHLCKNAQDKGVPAPVAVCSTCEVRDKCRSDGYLSQTPIAQSSQVLCIAQPKLFLDPLHRGFFRQLSQGQPSDRVCVIDEAKAHDLFIDCALPKAVLQQWVRDWSGEHLGEFAALVLDMLEVHSVSPYKVAELVNKFEDKDLQALSKQAARFRAPYEMIGRGATDPKTGNALSYHSVMFPNGVSVHVAYDFDAYERLLELDMPALQPQEVSEQGFMTLTPAQAFGLGVYEQSDLDSINTLPRLWEQSNWTPFQQLKRFVERYQREVDAPIWYTDGVLHWVIPPVVHSRVKHLVCMGATLQREGFERAFDSVPTAFIQTPPTPFVPGAKGFQVRTGKYPRGTLLDSARNEKGKYEYVGLSGSGKKYLGYIENEVARDPSVRHVLITFDFIVKEHGKQLTETHKNLSVLSFHKMEGLDFKGGGIVFWVFGAPEVSEDIVARRAKVLYGNDSKPLNYERDNGSREYEDPRVELCWLSEVAARLQQAVGRARLNRLANTVIVFSNVLIPDFTGRAVGFVPEDIEVAAGIDNLETVANQRLKAENDAPNVHKKTRKDRKQERQSNRERKAEQRKTGVALYDAGVSPADIAVRVGVDKRTVFRWVEKRGF